MPLLPGGSYELGPIRLSGLEDAITQHLLYLGLLGFASLWTSTVRRKMYWTCSMVKAIRFDAWLWYCAQSGCTTSVGTSNFCRGIVFDMTHICELSQLLGASHTKGDPCTRYARRLVVPFACPCPRWTCIGRPEQYIRSWELSSSSMILWIYDSRGPYGDEICGDSPTVENGWCRVLCAGNYHVLRQVLRAV